MFYICIYELYIVFYPQNNVKLVNIQIHIHTHTHTHTHTNEINLTNVF